MPKNLNDKISNTRIDTSHIADMLKEFIDEDISVLFSSNYGTISYGKITDQQKKQFDDALNNLSSIIAEIIKQNNI